MRLLLVEDDLDVGAALKQVLRQQAYVVDWVVDGTEAWEYLENGWVHYTLAVFDWLLPGLSGVELCKRLRTQNRPMPVLMLTAKAGMEEKIMGMDAGADDYLVKPFGIPELLARLRALRRRSPQCQQQLLQVGHLTLNYSTRNVSCQRSQGDNQVISLTMKEFQLLEYFMRHPNQIVSREQILNHLWEVGSEPVSNVVAAQMSLLRRKLTSDNRESLIETVYGRGYCLNTTGYCC